MIAKFKVGDVVLYRTGHFDHLGENDTYQLGVVHSAFIHHNTYYYEVHTENNNTTFVYPETILLEIKNVNNFTILRRTSNVESDQDPCRIVAINILKQMDLHVARAYGEENILFDDHVDTSGTDEVDDDLVVPGLIGGEYKALEDLVTNIIKRS